MGCAICFIINKLRFQLCTPKSHSLLPCMLANLGGFGVVHMHLRNNLELQMRNGSNLVGLCYDARKSK